VRLKELNLPTLSLPLFSNVDKKLRIYRIVCVCTPRPCFWCCPYPCSPKRNKNLRIYHMCGDSQALFLVLSLRTFAKGIKI
jgi:hypothetical protein